MTASTLNPPERTEGVYLYTLRKSKPIPSNLGPIYRYAHSSRARAIRGEVRALGIAHRAWEGVPGPVLVVEAYAIPGAPVYRQATPRHAWWDSDEVPGELVGVLRGTRVLSFAEEVTHCETMLAVCAAAGTPEAQKDAAGYRRQMAFAKRHIEKRQDRG